jgi:alkylation response protein AidB-like acyl-CoA dehydrogenase
MARAMQPKLRARADEIESTRHLPADLSAEFAQAGFYRLLAPEVYGGLESSPIACAETIELIAQADASAGWCLFIGATSSAVLAQLQPDAARAIFHKPETLMCGVFAPRGVATPEPGGFRVSGRWGWGSGTRNADWIMGGCLIAGRGESTTKSGAPQRSHMMIAAASEVELLDTWHVTGLCGTGSTDFAMHDVFVPEERAVGVLPAPPLERPLYAFPQFGLLAMGIASVSLGIARHAIDELIEVAAGKTPDGSRRTLAMRSSTQSEVAEAEARLRSARAFFYEALGTAYEYACAEGRIELEHRRDVRLATTHATRSAVDAVDRMYHLAGGTSVYLSSPLQRCFRDVHVASQHMMVSQSTLELTGRLFLGLETDASLL